VGEPASTTKGRATRTRVVAAASELIAAQGVAETSLDGVIERAAVSKGQLYHYFDDRGALLRAVVDYNTDLVIAAQSPHIELLGTWKAIRAWFDSMVAAQVAHDAHGGCPLGSLVGQLVESDEQSRRALVTSFDRWERHLRDGLRSMQRRGSLSRRADVERLAMATMAAIQGGLLLTQLRRDPQQLQIALDAAYSHLRVHAAPRSRGSVTAPRSNPPAVGKRAAIDGSSRESEPTGHRGRLG
jgi:AcrR family transcriptional regulator